MKLLLAIAGEIAAMFAGDGRLSLALLALVALTATIVAWSGLDPLYGGIFLLLSSILTLIASVRRAAGR